MAMKASFRIERPEEVEVSMTLTMPLRDWVAMAQQLPRGYPSWRLSAAIQELVAQARAEFTVEHDVKER